MQNVLMANYSACLVASSPDDRRLTVYWNAIVDDKMINDILHSKHFWKVSLNTEHGWDRCILFGKVSVEGADPELDIIVLFFNPSTKIEFN